MDQNQAAAPPPTHWPGRVTASEFRVVDGDTEQVVVTLTIPTSQLGVDSVRLTAERLRGRPVVLVVEAGRPVGLELLESDGGARRAVAFAAAAAAQRKGG